MALCTEEIWNTKGGYVESKKCDEDENYKQEIINIQKMRWKDKEITLDTQSARVLR